MFSKKIIIKTVTLINSKPCFFELSCFIFLSITKAITNAISSNSIITRSNSVYTFKIDFVTCCVVDNVKCPISLHTKLLLQQ